MFRLLALSVVVSGLISIAFPSNGSLNNDINKQQMIEEYNDDTPAIKDELTTHKKAAKKKALKYTSININTASIMELSLGLKHIGKTKAAAIVDYRTKNGNFKELNDLLKIKGIGKKLIKKNQERIRFTGESTI